MMAAFHRDTAQYRVEMFDEHDPRQGIVHVVGPEQGFTLPGTVMVCATATPRLTGRSARFAFGVGSSEIEHVFAYAHPVAQEASQPPRHIDGTPGPWCERQGHRIAGHAHPGY